MSPKENEDDGETRHPRETETLFGHGNAEATLLSAYRSGRIPHAFLIAGPKGIGKATLAYRAARFVLAHPDPAGHEVKSAKSLAIAADNPVARRIAAQGQPDLLIIERTLNDKGVLHKQIAVDDIRRTVTFFGSTAREGGWRIAIVDAVDELNASGANALLKVLEEPPQRALILLVSHSASRVPATLRSRCRILTLRPLAQEDVIAAVVAATGREANDEIAAAAAAATAVCCAPWPCSTATRSNCASKRSNCSTVWAVDSKALHALGEAIAGTDPAAACRVPRHYQCVAVAAARVRAGRDRQAGASRRGIGRMNTAVREAEIYALDRKPLVFGVFGLLAEATRG